MRVHLLAPPNSPVLKENALDGFCQRTILFAQLLKRLGHEVWLYGSGENTDAPCDRFVSCLTNDQYFGFVKGTAYQNVPFDGGTPLYQQFNATAAQKVRHEKGGADLIATITGSAQWKVSEYNAELPTLEYSIGYLGITGPYRIFQSHAWRHTIHGMTGVDCGRVGDDVIPPWFHVEDFPFQSEGRDYLVYCGRITPSKGINVVCRAAEASGLPLVVLGHGDHKLLTYGTYEGAVTTAERNRILSGARACLMPTQYIEPFGNVAAEAQLCGTPMITTDYGAFTESVEQGKTGYRCSTLGEFVQAIDIARYLDRAYVRARAVRLYSEDAAADRYTAYFAKLDQIRREGWTAMAPTLDVMPPLSALEGAMQ